MNYLLIVVIAVLCLVVWRFLFKKRWILDKPGVDNKERKKGVPTMLGIFVYLAFFLIVGFVYPSFFQSQIFWWLMAWATVIVVFEILDELSYLGRIKFKLNPVVRLWTHILASVVAVYVGWIEMKERIVNGHTLLIPKRLFVWLFSVWSIVCINAINWFDWVYAQASGVSSIGFLTIFLLIKFVVLKYYAWISPEHANILDMTQILALILFVISLVSTVIEYKPLWLLRDVGTMFFGFSIAYLSVVGWAKIWTLIVALSLVIFDAIWVWIHRLVVLKINPMKWDYRHLHYRLLRLGWNKGEVRSFVWIFSLVMMILMLIQGTNRTNKIIIFIVMALIFFGVNAYLFWIKKLPVGLEIEKKK